MLRTITTMMLAALFVGNYAFAHDAWIESKNGKPTVVYGHGAKLESYDPQKVKEAKAFDCEGKEIPVKIDRQASGVTLDSAKTPTMVVVFFDNGPWVQTTDGWKNMGKQEALKQFSVVDSSKNHKFAKAIFTPCDTPAKPTGVPFEIIPQKDPLTVKVGETLPVKVLLEGKPVSGVTVSSGDAGHDNAKNLPKTNEKGEAGVVIDKPGRQIIIASHKAPLKNDPDAENLSLSATLTFETH